MKLVIVAIRDSASGAYGRPNYVPTTGVAIRSFADEVNRRAEDNQLAMHPEDFEMFELGVWDDNSCEFELLGKPRSIARAKDLVRG